VLTALEHPQPYHSLPRCPGGRGANACSAVDVVGRAGRDGPGYRRRPDTGLGMLEWIMLGRPGHDAGWLKELHLRYAPAPALKKRVRASLWYRVRHRLLRLQDNWERLTCYHTLRYSQDLRNGCHQQPHGASDRLSGKGALPYHAGLQKRSISNVTGLTAWLFDQPAWYDEPLVRFLNVCQPRETWPFSPLIKFETIIREETQN
jgi:hypothetical protein